MSRRKKWNPDQRTRQLMAQVREAKAILAAGGSIVGIAARQLEHERAEAEKPPPVYREAPGFYFDTFVFNPSTGHPGFQRVDD